MTPFSPDPSLTELTSAIAGLRDQVAQLERKVAELQQARGPAPPAAAFPSPSIAKPKLESRFGLTVVNRVGALTLAIGIIFFFKYAVDNKWVGTEGLVAIGVAAGFILIAAAEWLRWRGQRSEGSAFDDRIFTQGIAGCGLAVLYVSLYASVGYYQLIEPWAGFLLLVLASACAIFLSVRYRSAAIAALGFIGALLTPVLLHRPGQAGLLQFVYLLVIGVTAVALAVRQHWPALVPIVATLNLFAAGFLYNQHHPASFAVFAFLLGTAHFLAVKFTVQDQRIANFAYIAGHACILIAAMRAVAIWAGAHSLQDYRGSFIGALLSVLLALYGIADLVYGMKRKSALDRSLGLVLLALVIVKLYLWDIWLLNRFFRVSAFVALGILLLAASYIYSRFRARTPDRPHP